MTNGNSARGYADVTCKSASFMSLSWQVLIQPANLFTDEDSVLPSSALNKNYVTNFSTLRPMGDKLMTALAKNLKLVDGGDGGSPTTTAGSNPTSESCEGEGHCAGKKSASHTFLRSC